MSEWRLLSRNPLTGVEEWWRHNGDGTCTIRVTQDVEPTLDRNTAEANHDDGWDSSKLFRRMARIPQVIVQDFRNKGINLLKPHEHEKELKRLMNDSDFRKLRNANWRV